MAVALSLKTLQDLRELVQINDHGGACELAAAKLGNADLAERFGSINRRQIELGHLPPSLYDTRQRLRQDLLAFAQSNLNEVDYKRLRSTV